jgi:OOP family OmpA-OmpF porin
MKIVKGVLLAAAVLPFLFVAAQADTTDDLIRQLDLSRGTRVTRGVRPHDTGAAAYTAPEPTVRRPMVARPVYSAPIARHNPAGAPAQAFAATPAAEAPAEPQGSANITVQFETGSDRLSAGATDILDHLGRALSSPELAKNEFRIIGHTDSVGRSDANQLLSERRAASVVDYIASHFGIDRSRLVAEGRGQSEPRVPTAPGVAEPRNRRVQIVNMGGD